MQKIHLLLKKTRAEYFETAAGKLNIAQSMIEKDYWVVFVLHRLFDFKDLHNHLTFKGGTSLSKAFRMIQRFSEDIDLSIEKDFFGFSDTNSPEKAASRKQRDKALNKLSEECSKYVQHSLLKKLKEVFSQHIPSFESWRVLIDDSDLAKQTIIFEYPTIFEHANNYIRPSIKIEMGARSEHWPVCHYRISSYLKENFKDKIDEPEVEIKVLNVERTFWEKATILHQYANIPAEKSLPLRLSRHYYDFYKLLNSPVRELALSNIDLLERVAVHKDIYFHSSWANYAFARKGTLKLFPSGKIVRDLRRDYQSMEAMFFEKPPQWDAILNDIEKFEREFNKK